MPRQHPLRDAALAVSLLTIVPTRVRWPEEGGTQVAAWFPAVGGLLGLVGYGAAKLVEAILGDHHAPLVLAALIVLVWALLTRLLHFDGLADVADGYWGSHEPVRRLEIMSDSHTGAFGASAVSLVSILMVVSIATILDAPHELPLLIVPVFSRFAATAAAWLGSPARPDGLGRSVMGRPTLLAGAIVAVTLGLALYAAWLGFAVVGLALGGFGLIVALGVPHVLALRFGGVTGDVMGASVLITEAILFAAFALVV
jgi:adenosylcobinamide-GDP ribazoletransferase